MTPIFVITIGDVVGLTLSAIVLSIVVIVMTIRGIKQALCKHDGTVGETQACDAICHKCGKNLGFIGTWRDKQKHFGVDE